MLKLLLLSLFGILVGCQPDDTINAGSSSVTQVTSRTLSFEELTAMPDMEGILSKFNTTHSPESSSAKVVRSAKYDFYIDTDRALYIESGSYHSYTFPIVRDSVNGYLENLFLHPHKDGYLAFLMRYKFSEGDMEKLNAGVKIDNLFPKLTIQPLDLDINIGDGIALQQPDYTTYGDWHAGDMVYWDGSCWYVNKVKATGKKDDPYEYTLAPCIGCTSCLPKPDQGGGGGSGQYLSPIMPYYQIVDLFGTHGHGVGNSSGSQSSSPNPFNPSGSGTNPIFGVVSPQLQTVDDRNLAELKKLGNNPLIMASFRTLKNNAVGARQEYGYAYSAANSIDALEYQSVYQVKLQFGGTIYAISHSHLDPTITDGIPMFSLSDIMGLAYLKSRYNDRSADPSIFTLTLTVKYSNREVHTFAIKIKNWASFSSFATQYQSMSEKDKKTLRNNLETAYTNQTKDSSSNVGPTSYLKTLMNYMKTIGLEGVDIYMSPNSSMTTWLKAEFDLTTSEPYSVNLNPTQ